jgi:hypothetical protein
MSFKKVDYKLINVEVNSSILHTNLNEQNDILLSVDNINLTEGQNFTDIIELIQSSVDQRLGEVKSAADQHGINLEYLKRQILLLEKFLNIIDRYLENKDSGNNELLHRIDIVVNDFINSFDHEDVMSLVNSDMKENQIINSLTNLMSCQIKMTEKLNKLNI